MGISAKDIQAAAVSRWAEVKGARKVTVRYIERSLGNDNSSFALGMQIINPYNATVTSINTYADSGYTQLTDPHVMTYGQKLYVRVKAKNIGSQTWSNSFMKVGTTDPTNRSSAFCDSSWPSCGRPAVMSETSVAPGQTGTFEFTMKAPSTANTYAEDFGLVAESQSYGWAPNGTFSLPTKVVSPLLDTIYPGERIFAGESITSKSGRYTLDLQKDGNLVIYGDGRALWASWTAGKSASYLAMQDDGNLVLYSTSGRPIWFTHTAGKGSSSLKIQNDGNLVIYDSKSTATWASHTWQAASMATSTNSLGSSGAQVMSSSQPLNSSSGKYQLVLQSDGNLVLYSGAHALWASWTNGDPVNRLVLQSDGNLVLYGSDNKAYWSSKTAGRGDNANLILQDDSNLVLYDSSNQAVWAAL